MQANYGLGSDGLVAISRRLTLAPSADDEIVTLGYRMRDPDALCSVISWPEQRRLAWAPVLKDLIENFEALAAHLSGALVGQTGTPSSVLLTAEVGVEGTPYAGQIQVIVYEEPELCLRMWVTSAPGDPYIFDPMPFPASNPRWADKVERIELLSSDYDEIMAQFVTRWTAELRQIPI